LVAIDGVLHVAERDCEPLNAERFRFARTFMQAIIRSDAPEVVADMLGVPRSEPGIEHL
jgi:hypothetical protein